MRTLEPIHRFEQDGRRFAVDPETCFCFECDAISWDVLEHYPDATANRVYDLLDGRYSRKDLEEVIGELEWLRATKSILAVPQREALLKAFEVERGLKKLSLLPHRDAEPAEAQARRRWFGRPETAAPPLAIEAVAHDAVALLLARSGTQRDLELEFVEPGAIRNPGAIAELAGEALRMAKLAGKNLTAVVRVSSIEMSKLPETIEGHTLSAAFAFQDAAALETQLAAFAGARPSTVARLAKALEPAAAGVSSRVIVQPNHGAFGQAVATLDKAGFAIVELDMDGAYAVNPALEPHRMIDGLKQSAVYYADRLLEHRYFRLDPIASVFWRIYNGTPLRRADPVGTNELAVDGAGGIYPCARWAGLEEFRLGSTAQGAIDEDRLLEFENVGSTTTPVCIRCWARNLCGGGNAAVHRALSGSFRTPHATWCDAQRAWLAAAVSAFHKLSSAGVHFERVYNVLGRREKPSLFALARAALTLTVAVRPIEEADAEMLARWENWSDAAYFVANETGVLLATKYDREMDSLHPRGIDQELLLIRKTGEPFGLFKVRPELIPGLARAWVYFRKDEDYASDAVRKGFRAILKEAGGAQGIRRLIVPAAPYERGLCAFLEAVGFAKAGVQREALYLHGRYHDVSLYSIAENEI